MYRLTATVLLAAAVVAGGATAASAKGSSWTSGPTVATVDGASLSPGRR